MHACVYVYMRMCACACVYIVCVHVCLCLCAFAARGSCDSQAKDTLSEFVVFKLTS